MSVKCTFLSLLVTLVCQLVLLDIRMATPVCVLGLFAWKTFFLPFYFDVESIFVARYVSCMQ